MTTATGNLSFSVIVNTIDRSDPLQTLLRALEHQSYPYFEVVVVVGPTRDNTFKILSEYKGRIRQINCPTANLCHSRNLGLLAAHGDIVAFIDDDAVPCQRWLEQYAEIFSDDAIQFAGGSVWAIHPNFSTLQFRLGIFSSLAEQVDVRSSWIDQINPPGKASKWISRFMGTNMVGRRQSFLNIRGFDEFYRLLADEADLALRLGNSEMNVYPVKEAVVYHIPGSSRFRQAFTTKGKWWIRTGARVYLTIKHGVNSGDMFKDIIYRGIRSAGANMPGYFVLLRDRQYSIFEFLWVSANEIFESIRATICGLLIPPQVIPLSHIETCKDRTEPILPYKNQNSSKKATVDPISGHQSQITLSEPPLRLCLLSGEYPPTAYGGVARLTHLMAKGLFELGHTVHVITRSEREEVTFYDGAYVHKIPHRPSRYDQYKQYFTLYHTLNYSHSVYEQVCRLVLNDGIQIVDSPLWQYEGLVTLVSGITPVVVRLVTALRQIGEIHHSHSMELTLIGDLERSLIEKANHVIPNTQATLDATLNVYDVELANQDWTIVPYGIVPVPDDQIRPFEVDLLDDTLTVLFVGRLEKRKGILDLFKAIPTVIREVPGVKFVIAGGDNSDNDGFKIRTGNDYATHFAHRYMSYLPFVEFTGMLSDRDLQKQYQSCDLFVAPSLYESFGLVYLEAMNFAKPVIGCWSGGVPEVVDQGVTGLLVDPESPKALAEAIVSLLRSPSKLREMGLAGRSQVVNRFSYLQMARNFANVYRQVINRNT